MTVRVLHIFAPGYKKRFGGPTYFWKYFFSSWNESKAEHYVWDSDNNRMVDAKTAFRFEYSGAQHKTPRWERIVWVFTLLAGLVRHRNQYDILHVHVLWWSTLLLGPLAKWMGIPTLYESVLLRGDTPAGIRNERFGTFKIRCLQSYGAILAISDSLAQEYLKFGFSPDQVYPLMNCLDTDLFSPGRSKPEKNAIRKRLGMPEEAKILLFVGSVIQRKGIDLLIHAFIAASSMDPGLCLLIVGPRNKNENPSLDEDFVQGLQSELEKKHLVGQVRFLGLVQDRQELADLYRAADMFVFPSRNEGLPGVVLEAMSSGLPVITSQLPGLENVIRSGENGIFVPIGDTAALKEAILMLCADPVLAGKIGSNAREYIVQHHGFRSWQADQVALYEHMLS